MTHEEFFTARPRFEAAMIEAADHFIGFDGGAFVTVNCVIHGGPNGTTSSSFAYTQDAVPGIGLADLGGDL